MLFFHYFFKAEGVKFEKKRAARVRGGSNWDSLKVGIKKNKKIKNKKKIKAEGGNFDDDFVKAEGGNFDDDFVKAEGGNFDDDFVKAEGANFDDDFVKAEGGNFDFFLFSFFFLSS